MKKVLLSLLVLLTTLSPLASLAEDAALIAAQALVPSDARLMEREHDGACLTLEFQDDAAHYEVALRQDDYAPLLLETEYRLPAAPFEPGEDATLHLTVEEEKDGAALRSLFLSEGEDLLVVLCLCQDETVLEVQRYFGGAAILPAADAAAEVLREQYGDLTLLELEISLDEDTLALTYEGEALLASGGCYEFEMNADGILSWNYEGPGR